VEKRVTYASIDPQPTDIITLHRYYTKLKDNESYRKRVTTVTEAPEWLSHLKTLAVIEYLGVKNSNSNHPHGNSKSSES